MKLVRINFKIPFLRKLKWWLWERLTKSGRAMRKMRKEEPLQYALEQLSRVSGIYTSSLRGMRKALDDMTVAFFFLKYFPEEIVMQEIYHNGSVGGVKTAKTVEELLPHIKLSLASPLVKCVKVYLVANSTKVASEEEFHNIKDVIKNPT